VTWAYHLAFVLVAAGALTAAAAVLLHWNWPAGYEYSPYTGPVVPVASPGPCPVAPGPVSYMRVATRGSEMVVPISCDAAIHYRADWSRALVVPGVQWGALYVVDLPEDASYVVLLGAPVRAAAYAVGRPHRAYNYTAYVFGDEVYVARIIDCTPHAMYANVTVCVAWYERAERAEFVEARLAGHPAVHYFIHYREVRAP